MKNYELMGLTTVSGTPILKPVVAMLCHAYLDYVNNYCELDKWSYTYGISEADTGSFYNLCRNVYNAENEEY